MRFAAAGVFCLFGSAAMAQSVALPKGIYSFGPDQTIADIGKVEWAPLKLDGFAPGIEIASLRGDLAKGGAEILLRTPPNAQSQPYDRRGVRLVKGRIHLYRR